MPAPRRDGWHVGESSLREEALLLPLHRLGRGELGAATSPGLLLWAAPLGALHESSCAASLGPSRSAPAAQSPLDFPHGT